MLPADASALSALIVPNVREFAPATGQDRPQGQEFGTLLEGQGARPDAPVKAATSSSRRQEKNADTEQDAPHESDAVRPLTKKVVRPEHDHSADATSTASVEEAAPADGEAVPLQEAVAPDATHAVAALLFPFLADVTAWLRDVKPNVEGVSETQAAALQGLVDRLQALQGDAELNADEDIAQGLQALLSKLQALQQALVVSSTVTPERQASKTDAAPPPSVWEAHVPDASETSFVHRQDILSALTRVGVWTDRATRTMQALATLPVADQLSTDAWALHAETHAESALSRPQSHASVGVSEVEVRTQKTEPRVAAPITQDTSSTEETALISNPVIEADTSDSNTDSGDAGAGDARMATPSTPLPSNDNTPRVSENTFAKALSQAQLPSPAEQLTAQVKMAVKNGESRIVMQLHPVELGQLEIRLDVREGTAKLMVQADNSRTLDMLRSDARTLERLLTDVGFKTDNASLSFNLRGDGQQTGQGQQQGGGQRRAPVVETADALDEALVNAAVRAYTLASPDELDIHV